MTVFYTENINEKFAKKGIAKNKKIGYNGIVIEKNGDSNGPVAQLVRAHA